MITAKRKRGKYCQYIREVKTLNETLFKANVILLKANSLSILIPKEMLTQLMES